MADIKLKPETVEVIDTLFALAENSSDPKLLQDFSQMPEEEWHGWVMKVQTALIDWMGYKTFLDM